MNSFRNFGKVTRPTKNSIETNNDLFNDRISKFNRGKEGVDLRDQLRKIRRRFYEVYRQAALEHWKENGTNASTGWGCTPEGEYQSPLSVNASAHELANKLVDVVTSDPDWKG